MSVYSALSPISTGIFTALNVASLLALAPGGVHDALPQNTAFPCVLFEVSDEDASTFGARPGSGAGSMVTVRLRCHVFSQYAGMKEAQAVMAKLRQLLSTPPSATGYHVWEIFPRPTVPLANEELAGVPVRELVGDWLLYVEEA